MAIETKFKRLPKSQGELTLELKKEEIEKAYQKKLQDYSKKIEIDGFRRGHAPLNVIERKFGAPIREESTFQLMEDSLQEALKELKTDESPLPYSTPVLQDEDSLLPFKKDQDITYRVIYDVYPSFELPKYTGLTVETNKVKIEDSDIDAEIETLRDQNALVRKKEGSAENGDIVTIDYYELDENGNKIEESERKDYSFTLGTKYNVYKIDDDVVGMKAGDEKEAEKTYNSDDDPSFLKGRTIKLHIKLDEVKKRELPELDDEFAQDVKDEYKTVKDLKEGIKKDLEKKAKDIIDHEKEHKIVDEIAKETSIEIPESMLENQLEDSWRRFVSQTGMAENMLMSFIKSQGQTKESIQEGWKDEATEHLKEQLILEEIRKKEDIKVSDEELESEFDKQFKDIQDENVKNYYKELLKDELEFSKVVPFLIEKNTFKEGKTITYKELMERGKEHSHE